jgi:hypothetical protein
MFGGLCRTRTCDLSHVKVLQGLLKFKRFQGFALLASHYHYLRICSFVAKCGVFESDNPIVVTNGHKEKALIP